MGRKHHLAVEVEGQSYELVLGAEAHMQKDSLLHKEELLEPRQEALGDGADQVDTFTSYAFDTGRHWLVGLGICGIV